MDMIPDPELWDDTWLSSFMGELQSDPSSKHLVQSANKQYCSEVSSLSPLEKDWLLTTLIQRYLHNSGSKHPGDKNASELNPEGSWLGTSSRPGSNDISLRNTPTCNTTINDKAVTGVRTSTESTFSSTHARPIGNGKSSYISAPGLHQHSVLVSGGMSPGAVITPITHAEQPFWPSGAFESNAFSESEGLRNIGDSTDLEQSNQMTRRDRESCVKALSTSTIDPPKISTYSTKKRKSVQEDYGVTIECEDNTPSEKRYRNKLNATMKELISVVPTLRATVEGQSLGKYEAAENSLQPARNCKKPTVLSKTIEYIRFLEQQNETLSQLVNRI